jgi:acyl-CoA oxidase
MMQVRAMIVQGAAKALSMACTIIIRYSAVRKQGYAEDGKTELQVLDYTQQQHRIFPLLAASYAFHFTGNRLWDKLKDVEHRLLASQPVQKTEVSDIHASSSALKSFSTIIAADGIEECRKACGGHGFLASSGLPELFTTYLQSPTVEGDNHMLPQQVIRVLLKLVAAVQRNNQEDLQKYESCDSFALIPSLKAILNGVHEECPAIYAKDFCDLQLILGALRHRAAYLLVVVAQQIDRQVKKEGVSQQTAWNSALVAMAKASKAYSLFLFLQDFMEGIEQERRKLTIGPKEIEVLSDLARLFGLFWMDKDSGDFLEDGYFRPEHSRWVARNVLKYLAIIRKNAVALVDARDFSDFRLKSALGRFDGNVYPAIIVSSMKDPLNAVDPGPAYDPELKRLIVGGVGIYSGTASRL